MGAGVAQRGWGPHAGVGRVSLRAVFVAAAGKVLFTGSPSRDARSLTVSRLRHPLAFSGATDVKDHLGAIIFETQHDGRLPELQRHKAAKAS